MEEKKNKYIAVAYKLYTNEKTDVYNKEKIVYNI